MHAELKQQKSFEFFFLFEEIPQEGISIFKTVAVSTEHTNK